MERGTSRSVADWRPARKYPETYPGDRPADSYLLFDDRVFPLEVDKTLELSWRSPENGPESLDRLLLRLQLRSVGGRVALLAYGANRNPATLHIKLLNYKYRSPGHALVVPVLRGRMPHADVVAAGLHGQGYLYGDLVARSAQTEGTDVEVWITLLDEDQLRAINDSEHIRDGLYSVARFDDVTIDGLPGKASVLGYASHLPPLFSPVYGSPVAFASVQASGRRLVAMEPLEMLEHCLNAFGVRDEIAEIAALDTGPRLAPDLMSFLNRQWWHNFNTGELPLASYRRVLDLMNKKIRTAASTESTAARLAAHSAILSTREAYEPSSEFTFESLLKAARKERGSM